MAHPHSNADPLRALLQCPFVPFIVLFCHVIETRDEQDLDRLGGLIGSLQSATTDSFSTGVMRELRLFKVLYDVACSYINMKADDGASAEHGADTETEGWVDAFSVLPTPAGVQPAAIALTGLDMSVGTEPLPGMQSSQQHNSPADVGSAIIDLQEDHGSLAGDPFPLSGGFEMMNQQGAQLSNLLYMNHQMMRALEDGYF